MISWIAKLLYFKLQGWKLIGKFPKLKKYIIIVAPHTSWVDFFLALAVRRISGLKMNYIGKKELFDSPLGWYFKLTGGAPVDRSKSTNKVDAIVSLFEEKDEFRLAMAPEGTRKKVNTWKTGFYYVALKANVPIIAVAFDFGNKEVKINTPFYPTGNIEEDMVKIKSFYKDVVGKIPEYT